MTLIRPRQRILTGVFPHAGNASYIVPKRKKGQVIAEAGWTIGTNGFALKGFRANDFGALVPGILGDGEVELFHVHDATHLVSLRFVGGHHVGEYASASVDVEGWSGSPVLMPWSEANQQFEVIDTPFTSFIQGQLDNLLAVNFHGVGSATFRLVMTPELGAGNRRGYRDLPGTSSFGALSPDQAFFDFVAELNLDDSWLSISFGNKELPSLPIVFDSLLFEDSLFPGEVLSLDYIADPLAVGRYRLSAGAPFDARRAAWDAAIAADDDIDIILTGVPAEVRYDEYLLTIAVGTGGNVGMRNRPGSAVFGSISNDDGPNGTIIREAQIDNSGLMQLQWGLVTDAGGEGRQVYFDNEAWLFDSTAPTIGDDLVDIALINVGTGRYRPSVGDQNPRRTRWLLDEGNEITLTVFGRVDPDNTLFPPP